MMIRLLRFVRLLLCLMGLFLLGLAPARAQTNRVQTDQVTVTLLAHAPQGVVLVDEPSAATGTNGAGLLGHGGSSSMGLHLGRAGGTGLSLPGLDEVAPQANTATDPASPVRIQEVWLGLRFVHAPHWHTYWQNPGDSGLPTELNWTLPAGVHPEPIDWPAPQKIFIGDLANYGYEGDVLLPVRLRFDPDFAPAAGETSLRVGLQASWLVCHQECLPQSGQFQLEVPLHGSTALDGPLFEAAWARRPHTLTASSADRAHLNDQATRLQVQLSQLPADWQGRPLLWLPETADVLVNGSQPVTQGQTPLNERQWTQHWEGGVWHADLPISPFRGASPDAFTLVLLQPDNPSAPAQRITVPVQGEWPALNTPAALSPELQAALEANAAKAQENAAAVPAAVTSASLTGWVLALGGALLGGLLLNLMPCVFPVLAIKLLGFSRASDAASARASALGYSAGVLLTCLLLGGALLGLRAAGQQLGWGFQLQSPWMVLALAALFTAIALNLFGLFDVRVDRVTGALPTEIRGRPALDNLYAGVLAVVVATPCTAPFMGASMGLAVSLPAWQALGIFAALGLGLALPVLLTLLFPGWLRWLPRSGPWMQRVRELLGFPMLATAIWLMWVLGQQTGLDGLIAALALLLAEAFALWLWFLPGRHKLLRIALGVVAVALALGWAHPEMNRAQPEAGAAPTAAADAWQPWSQAEVDTTLAQGRPVFIDFTAAWCITCQYNKKTTLANVDVLTAFAQKNVRLLRADWTRQDPLITAALQALGRSGVPVYVLLVPGRAPQVFTEILRAGELLDALAPLPVKTQ